jgi:RNA polymerase sigma-70 factor (ECF subfamily)
MIDLLRKENVYEQKVIHIIDKYSFYPDEVWDRLAEKELKHKLAEALEEMPPMRRKVFEMSRFNGMTYQQIANELSLSPRTVEAHIFQAVKQLKQNLGLPLTLVLLSALL